VANDGGSPWRFRYGGFVKTDLTVNGGTVKRLRFLAHRYPREWAVEKQKTVGHVQYDYPFMPANATLRCQSNKADRSSWARDDGVVDTAKDGARRAPMTTQAARN
jgi:hypothetical protein